MSDFAEASSADSAEPSGEPSAMPQRSDMATLSRFGFHQLVNLLELRNPTRPPVGTVSDVAREHVLFRAARSLSFGPGDIADIGWTGPDDRLEIRVNFLGLYGPASPLPPAYTERIIEEDQMPAAVEDLLDVFNHRLISLFHLIWRKHRHFLRYEAGGADAISRRFLALCGFPVDDRSHIGQISRAALLPHVGLLSLHSSSAETVAATVSNFFDMPCSVEEFISRSVEIPEADMCPFGMGRMGEDIIVGNSVTDDFGKFRIRLGEGDFETLLPYLPGGSRHGALIEILSMVNREPLDWDIEFRFRPGTVPAGRLGESPLGWAFFIDAPTPDLIDSTIVMSPVYPPHAGGRA
jgi:type VI secretion system protein ImpH